MAQNFISRLFGRTPQVESVSKATTVNVNDPRFTIGTVTGTQVSQPNLNGQSIRKHGFEGNPVVSACIRTISTVAGSIPLEVYQYDKDMNTNGVYKHPLLDVFKNPWGNVSPMQFRVVTFAHLVTYGNAFWHIHRGATGKPFKLKIVSPESNITAYRDKTTGIVTMYTYTNELGHRVNVVSDDMIHFRDISLIDDVFGFPRAISALSEILTDNEANTYVRQIVKNDGRPGLVISGENMTPEELQAAQSAWNEKMVGRGERGKTVFMGGNMKLEQLGFDLNALEFPDLRRISRESMCAAFGVDPRMIGIGSAGSDAGLSGTQYIEARSRLFTHTIQPLMQLMEEHLDHWLASEFGEVYVRFCPEDIANLTTNPVELSTRMTNEYKSGIRGLKETRLAVGLPEDMSPDDTLFSPPPMVQPNVQSL